MRLSVIQSQAKISEKTLSPRKQPPRKASPAKAGKVESTVVQSQTVGASDLETSMNKEGESEKEEDKEGAGDKKNGCDCHETLKFECFDHKGWLNHEWVEENGICNECSKRFGTQKEEGGVPLTPSKPCYGCFRGVLGETDCTRSYCTGCYNGIVCGTIKIQK